jgi:lysyl-tRNA synthetase class 2
LSSKVESGSQGTMSPETFIRGRLLGASLNQATVLTQQGTVTTPLQGLRDSQGQDLSPEKVVGGIVSIKNQIGTLLTPGQLRTQAHGYAHRILDPRRQAAMKMRSRVETGIRRFFTERAFLETRTPLLVPCPGMEPHIRPFEVVSHSEMAPTYLPTSPEFAMKRLLVGGLERIFQLCPAFRDEPRSRTHRPEFSMLEWYRAYAGMEEILSDTENLIEFLAIEIFGKPEIPYQGEVISVKTPWPRLKIRDLFLEKAQINLTQSSTVEALEEHCKRLALGASNPESSVSWDDLYFKIWLNIIEPQLPKNSAVFVTHYPASQAALAVIETDADGSSWARRFEVYAGGFELGNAFEELTNPEEQKQRFIHDMQHRVETYGSSFPPNPLDEDFLQALEEGMPPSGGIAMGVDRLVMLFANEPEIDYTFWL